MAGATEDFRNVSAYATNLAGLDIIAIGDTERGAADEIQAHGSAADGGVTQVFVRGGKVVGATMVGRNAHRTALTNAIKDGLATADIKLV
ncbi:hypothetical protein EBS80_00515 [bacterium]|nr:hypothetical protein [bacterium]